MLLFMCVQKAGETVNAKTGRPLSENPKTERLYIRVTPDEKQQIFEYCQKNRITVLDLIRNGMKAVKKK